MDLKYFLFDILKLAGGVGLAFTFVYIMIRPDIQKYLQLKMRGLAKEDKPQLLSLRLQASERLILFVERINPANLLIRTHQQGIALRDLQSILLNEIRSEYQHNVTQQLYVNPSIWKVVAKLKDDTIAMINTATQHLPDGAQGVDLSKKVLTHLSAMEENPYELTLELIKKDIQRLF